MLAPLERVEVEKDCKLPLQTVVGPVRETVGKGFTVTMMERSTVHPLVFVSRNANVSRPAVFHTTVNCDDVVSPTLINPNFGRDQRYVLPGVTTPTL